MTHTITEITQAVRNSDRVNLFVNNVFWLGMNKNDLLNHRLFKGQVLTEEEKSAIEAANFDQKLLDRAILYVQLRPRSISEMRDYLRYKRKLTPEEADKLIGVLQEKELLSDEKFAQWYVEYKLNSGVNGVNKIKTELLQKRVDSKIIANVLDSLQTSETYPEEQEEKALTFAKKVLPTIKAKNDYEFRTKLMQRLLTRGFTYQQVKTVIIALTAEHLLPEKK